MTKEKKEAYLKEILSAWEAKDYEEVLWLLASNQRDKGDLGSFFEYHTEEYEKWEE